MATHTSVNDPCTESMNSLSMPPSSERKLLLILSAMWITFVGLRLSLHLGGVRHVYPGGHLVHHFFFGAMLLIPAAFLLVFPPRGRGLRIANFAVLGVACGLMLDEFVYLLATHASDADYVSGVSLAGALVLVSSATVLLLGIYFTRRK
ncbi:MAG TPA: hypothetical protein VFI45_05105 [Candidatus Acidoferrum sp.]|nr:hypothetical protein [Candidatus Acidoferrum sp.]